MNLLLISRSLPLAVASTLAISMSLCPTVSVRAQESLTAVTASAESSAAAVTVDKLSSAAVTILRSRCFSCHGEEKREGGLRLVSSENLFTRNNSGEPAVVPGSSATSELLRRVTSNDPDDRMPVEADPLPNVEIEALRNWIDAGAKWPVVANGKPIHWAYIAPVRPPVPGVAERAGRKDATTNNPANDVSVTSPIDGFVEDRLRKLDPPLVLAPQEEPARLLRRVYLDLTGLPPSPRDVDEFLADASPEHFARIVDRLLDSPRYGEKWARQWLDLARYADSNGYQADQFRSVWAYRDWVIDAFNRDMPFDQFTIEQLAGDLLPMATDSQRIATGFHRLTTCNVEAGVDPEENRCNQIADRVSTTATVWLGSTFECARCHNHKYDPLTQQDFYQVFAFFNNTPLEVEAPAGGGVQFEVAGPMMNLPLGDDQQSQREDLQAKLIDARKRLRATTDRKAVQAEIAELQKSVAALVPATTPVMVEMPDARASFIFKRGDFLSRGADVRPGTPAVLHPLEPVANSANVSGAATDAGGNPSSELTRLDFAKWLVSTKNPLVARVTVNRWWAEFFGRGLVATLEDFGTQGERPSHPELLDWLAVEFMERGWSMKHIHRLIVLSRTYQQSSRVTAEMLERDPANALLARGSRYRMSAEMIRDNALAISGLLSAKAGGPPVYPPQPDNIWRHTGRNAPVYATDDDEDRFRRGIYVIWRRSAPYPSFVNFDAPDRASCVVSRSRTNTPLQALTLLNDEAYVEMARAFGRRVLTERPGASLYQQLDLAFRIALARNPSSVERSALESVWERASARYADSRQSAEELIPARDRLEGVTIQDQAAWVSVASVLLNLDEVITRN